MAVVLLLLDGAWGLALMAGTVPFSGMDEPWHWMRAEQISRGELLARRLGPNDWGGSVDRHTQELAMAVAFPIAEQRPMPMSAFRQIAASGRSGGPSIVTASFPSTASYPPLAYLPNAAGIAVSRGLGGDLVAQAWCGRLAGFLVYLALVALIAWVLPVGRLAALVLLASPTALYLATSFSGDPLNIALPVLLAAWCLRLRLRPQMRLDGWRRAALLLLALAMGLLKMTSVVFAGAVLLLPASRFISRRGWAAFAGAAIGGAALVGGLWVRAYPFVPGAYYNRPVDPHRAVAQIIVNPEEFAGLLWRTMSGLAWFFWREGYARFGGGPGAYHFIVDGPWCAAALAAVVLLASGEVARPRDWVAAGWLAAVAATNAAAVLTAFRIAFTSPDIDGIDGLQGRYFIVPEMLSIAALSLLMPAWPIMRAVSNGITVCLAALAALSQGAVIEIALRHYRALFL